MAPRKGERPAASKINWDELEKLVSYQCTAVEVASFFNISVDTLDRACIERFNETYAEFSSKKKAVGRLKLRKIQMQNIEKGLPGWATVAIWLDKKFFPDENPDRPPILVPPENPKIAEKVVVSFSDFCANAKYPRPFPQQEKMREFAFLKDVPRLLLGSRGYGKTDYITVLGIAYEVYLDYMQASLPSDTNLIITKSRIRNTAIVEEIAEALIANGVELEKQNASCIRVKGLIGKDHSVETLTIKSSFRGRHPKRTIMDDPVTEEDVSDAMRILVKRKYDEAYKLCKNMLVIGQPAHAFDLYSELRPILEKLEVPWGSIPELDADLEAMKLAGVDAHSIEMSYHLRVPEDGSSIFSNLKFIDKFPEGDAVAFLDPSDGGDYTALSCFRSVFDGMAVYGSTWKRAWYHCLDDILKVLLERNVRRLAFETNKHGNQPIEQLQNLLAPHGIGVVAWHSTSNKHASIQAAGSYAHMIYLSRESEKNYTNQVVKYEYKAKFDDGPDSLARGLEWLGLLRGKR